MIKLFHSYSKRSSLQGRAVLVEILKKRARNKAAKAKASSGKRKGQSQGWRRGGKMKKRQ